MWKLATDDWSLIDKSNATDFLHRIDSDCDGIVTAPENFDNLIILGWVLGVLTIISNSIIVVLTVHLLKTGEEPRCTYMLLGNIAVSDFLTALIQLVDFSSLNIKYVDDTKIICILIAGTNASITLVSVYSVLLISIDRFLYIIHGIRYNQLVLPHKVGLMIFVVWVLSISFGIVPLFFWNVETSEDGMCWYPHIASDSLLIIEAVLGMIPIIYVLMLYSIILYKAIENVIIIRKMLPKTPSNESMEVEFCKGKVKLKQTTFDDGNTISVISKRSYTLQIYTVNVNENTEEGEERNKVESTENDINVLRKTRKSVPKKSKAIKVVLLTAGCFTFTWFPYFILSIIFAAAEKEDSITNWCSLIVTLRISSYVGALNSFFNPLIYAWWHNRFRKSVKKLYCGRRKEIEIRDSNNN